MSERQSERRVVTALFVDLVGSAALTARLGPERVKRALDRAFADLQAIITAEGGTVEKYVGDAVHALFGAPIAHPDDPLRALRAADGCRRWAEAAAARPVPLAVRIGVETGEAIVDLAAMASERQQMSVGACVNLAARLQQVAEPGQALVGPACHAATAEAAECESLGEIDLKGLGRLPVWRLVALGAPRTPTRLPFVGREAELDLLGLAHRRALSGRSVLALVLGPPGQGKTRLVEELLARLGDGVHVLTARCRPGGEAGAREPLRALLAEGASEPSREALAARLERLFLDAGERTRVGATLAHAAGLEVSPDLLARSVAERQDEVANAWRRYLGALARERPLVLWIEDLHWAEAGFVGLLDRLSAGSRMPVLFVGTARPEFAERAGLRPSGDRFFVELSALDADAALLLARHAGGRDDLAVARAEGNPLFIIELVRSGRHDATADVPLTLQGIIGARLDELPPPERELLQRAAVVGETFTAGDAALLSGRDPAEVAQSLGRLADLLYLDPVPGGHRFHHALVRDVAYGRLPAAERLALHARYAREGVGAEDVDAMAHHLWEALGSPEAEWVWEGSPERAELGRRAFAAHLAAGRRAAERFALARALELYRRALGFADGPEEAARVEWAIAAAHAGRAEGDLAWEHYQRARGLYGEVGRPPPELYAEVLELVAWTPGTFRQAPPEAAVEALFAEGEARARAAGAMAPLARLLGARTHRTADPGPLREGLAIFEAAPDAAPFGPFLVHAAAHQVRWGDFAGATRTFERLDRLSAAGRPVDQVEEYRTLLALHTGDLALADDTARRFALANAARGPHLRTHAFRERVHVLLARGDWPALARLADEVERLVAGHPGTAFCYAVTSARAGGVVAHCLLGQGAEAEAWLARTAIRLTTLLFSHEESVMLAQAVMGRRGEVDRLLREVRASGRLPYFLRRTEAVVLTMLERWEELDEPIEALAALAPASGYLDALVTAIREERAAARGGPSPEHARLRALGYAGWSRLLRHRPRGA